MTGVLDGVRVLELGQVLAGQIADEPVSAKAGDSVVAPEGRSFGYAASGINPVHAIVVHTHT
ncbi:hypothetical protein ACFOHU_11270 [Ottowia pentelensis]|uniref:Uncharacterized protein n=1 Tax=Ottowia pentelensis TaxID=511108 RepID=A0ABV6PS38_9BURK